MDIWGTFFKKRREAEAMVNRIIGAAEERARMPVGPHKSAELAESIRGKLFDLIESVEAKSGSYAYALAGDDETLMVSDALMAALKNHPESELLEAAFPLLFTTRAIKKDVTGHWPSTVKSFQGKRNDADTLKDKAGALAWNILIHYDIPCHVLLAETGAAPKVDENVELELKLEAAAAWYRLVDELAFRHIRPERGLFSDYLQDTLAELLALQGASPDGITGRMVERSTEYAGLKDWTTREPGQDASTLLWHVGKHALAPLGAEKNALRIAVHGTLLLEALKSAMVPELLSGSPIREEPERERETPRHDVEP